MNYDNALVTEKRCLEWHIYCFNLLVNSLSGVDGSEMIVRSCGMKSMDNMCGHFRFDNTDYQGCMMSCNHDACNGAGTNLPFSAICAVLFLLGIFLGSV